jgi:predicted nucleic acid-binding protein
MANAVVADASVLIALISRIDRHHGWAVSQARQWPAPWLTCESALSEAFFLCGITGRKPLTDFVRSGLVKLQFDLATEIEPVLALMEKYRDVPMSLADACLVRMTEIVAEPIVLTTDSDFRLYRRHSRHVVPSVMP